MGCQSLDTFFISILDLTYAASISKTPFVLSGSHNSLGEPRLPFFYSVKKPIVDKLAPLRLVHLLHRSHQIMLMLVLFLPLMLVVFTAVVLIPMAIIYFGRRAEVERRWERMREREPLVEDENVDNFLR